jgi:PIN domain nuclease of toxin-antitoxin system
VILLLDAHAVLWALAGGQQLRPDTRSAVEDPAHEVLVSAATVWEIEIKRVAGRLEAPMDLLPAIEATGFMTLPITAADAELAARLPGHHKDPFDRMLVSQATRLDAFIVTRDSVIAAYDVHVLPA